MSVKLPIRNLEKVQAYLKTVPHGTKKIAIEAYTRYLIGLEGAPGPGRHGLSRKDPYKQTTRAKVYGQTFESDKQRKYVMAAIKSGEIKKGQRKGHATKAEGYTYKLTNSGYGATIENKEESAYWSRVWGGWKNWRSVQQVIIDNTKGAMRHATSRINAFLKKGSSK
ncbi:MAG: hypothetical protein GY774_40025 [Planctomycetes bacterium]|nr:hypothetical protein [Planctomycetota bacterium]